MFRVFQSATQALGCDVNGDGVVNVRDVQNIIDQIMGTAPATADINGDGSVSILDLQILVNDILFGACNG